LRASGQHLQLEGSAQKYGKMLKYIISEVSHLPYSPDFVLCNFFFFPKLKAKLWRFYSRVCNWKVTRKLGAILKEFQACLQKWQDLWNQAIHWQTTLKRINFS